MAVTIAQPRVQHTAHHRLFRGRGEKDVDEARARDFHLVDEVGFRQGRDQRIGNVARRFAQRLGQLHRQIAGVIAVRCLFRALDRDRCRRQFGRHLTQCMAENFGKMGIEIENYRHRRPPFERRGL